MSPIGLHDLHVADRFRIAVTRSLLNVHANVLDWLGNIGLCSIANRMTLQPSRYTQRNMRWTRETDRRTTHRHPVLRCRDASDIRRREAHAGMRHRTAWHSLAEGGRLDAAVSPQGATIIDDTYNANPSSLQAGLEVLAMMPGKRILVLGDMAELGDDSEELHSQVASLAREQDVQYLFALGEQSAIAVEKFGNGGRHFTSHDELAASLRTELNEHSVVLIKGSRRMQMERIVNAMHEEH